MTKKKPYWGCDQEPEFDEKYNAKNMPFHATHDVTKDNGEKYTLTNVICLDDEGNICIRQYKDGELSINSRFSDYEIYKQWFEYENRLHKQFQEWMDEYEKNKARIVKIQKPIQ